MAIVDINGTLVDFPDDLTPDQLNQAVASAAQQMGATQPQQGLMGRAWEALKIPEQKAQQLMGFAAQNTPQFSGRNAGNLLANMVPGIGAGLTPLAQIAGSRLSPASSEPSGNLVQDLVTGAPRVGMEILKDYVPGNVSRGALVTLGASKAAGAAARPVKALLRGIGKQGESLSGSMPGSLEAAYKDASLMFGKGRKAAQETYEAAKAGEKIQYGEKLSSAKKFFDAAFAKAKAGALGPVEALEARKIADELVDSGSYVADEIMQKRKLFDEVAKRAFGAADAQFKRALQSESLRNIFPQNKYGGTSAFKLAIMTALKKMGGVGAAASTLLSPIVQGTLATGAGVAARNLIPGPTAAAVGFNALSEAIRRRKEKSNAR